MFYKTLCSSLLLLSQLANAAAVVQNSAYNTSPARRDVAGTITTCPTGGTFLSAPLFIIYLGYTINSVESGVAPDTEYWVFEIQSDTSCAFYEVRDGSFTLTGQPGAQGTCTIKDGVANGVFDLVNGLGWKYEASVHIGSVEDLCLNDATFVSGDLYIFDIPSGAGNLDDISTAQCSLQSCHNTVIH